MLLGTVIYVIDYFTKEEIGGILKKWIPWGLKVNFLLIVFGILFCYRDIFDAFKQFLNKRGILLAAVFLCALISSSIIVPRTHRIFYDEDIYANIGQNIALTNQTGLCNYGTFEYGEYTPHWISYNKEPSGWPFLIGLAFQLFGTNEFYAFALNNILFSAGLLVVFFITRRLTGTYFTALLASVAFALIPHNLIWANTAAAEPSASLFAGITVLAILVFLKTGNARHLFLLATLIPFTSQMRPESILIFLWVIVTFLVLSPRIFINRQVWSFGLLTTLFLLPHILHIYATSGHSWGSEGAKFSLGFFWDNLSINGIYYLNNRLFPVFLTALGVLGLIFSKHSLKWRLLILFWFLLFWGIFLFFYAGSYEYGADVRFSLVSFMPLAILAGMGGGFIREKIDSGFKMQDTGYKNPVPSSSQYIVPSLLIFVMLFSFVRFLPLIRQVGQEAWGARYDHKYAREFSAKIPRRSIVLTHNPTMFLLWNRNAIQTYAGINNPDLIKQLMEKYKGHVYFHYNYWCNTRSVTNKRLCQAIREKYWLKKVVGAREQDYWYALYQISIKGSK